MFINVFCFVIDLEMYFSSAQFWFSFILMKIPHGLHFCEQGWCLRDLWEHWSKNAPSVTVAKRTFPSVFISLVGEGLSVSPFASVFSQWMSREIPGSGEALRREFRRVIVLVLVSVVLGIEAIVMNASCKGIYWQNAGVSPTQSGSRALSRSEAGVSGGATCWRSHSWWGAEVGLSPARSDASSSSRCPATSACFQGSHAHSAEVVKNGKRLLCCLLPNFVPEAGARSRKPF